MQDDDLLVGTSVDIEFKSIGAVLKREAEGLEGILRRASTRATVGDVDGPAGWSRSQGTWRILRRGWAVSGVSRPRMSTTP